MTGGLMQIVAYGAQDVYITGNPQITFFKLVYRRHTLFSMESIEHSLNGNPDFGRRASVTITRNGDLITKIYLFVKLERVVPSEGSKFAWVRRIGHALIHSVEVEIGGSKIDKQYGIWLNIWYELARHPGDGERGFLKMIGDVPELTRYDECPKPEYVLYIPLKFWFNRHVGLALPLIALQYHEVRLHFEFTRVEDLVVANRCFRQKDLKCVQMKDALILVDYIYLDSEERRRFAQVGHEYLIEQLQFTGEESVQTQTGKYKLDFNHPTKFLTWAIRNGCYSAGKPFLAYTHLDDWSLILEDAAIKILLESMVLRCGTICEVDQYGNPCVISPGEEPPSDGEWEPFAPGERKYTQNCKVFVVNDCSDKCLWINTSSLKVKKCPNYVLTDKIHADVHVDENCKVSVTNVKTTLTVRDLSFPVDELCDTRAERDDPYVNQFDNFGILIDGSGNPVEYALLQLNGHDRFDRREGAYFNYVQPDQHFTNTPADGINVYSFALQPEQHQPSGTANLSRIDNTQLNLWFYDSTYRPGLPPLNYLCCDNKLYIFGFSYNVLRIMLDKIYFWACKSSLPSGFGASWKSSQSSNVLFRTKTATSFGFLNKETKAISSNCGDILKSFLLNRKRNFPMVQTNQLEKSKIRMNTWMSAQQIPSKLKDKVQRLNGDRFIFNF